MHGNPAARADLHALIKAHRFCRLRGTILKVEADECRCDYFLLSGWMASSKSTLDGHRQIIDILLPGEALDPTLGEGKSSAVQIETLGNVDYAAVSAAACAFRHHGCGGPDDKLGPIEHVRELCLGKGSAASMIAFALCELCVRSAPSGLIEGKTYHIPMTQAQLGDFCGLSAVHVCRTVRRFKRNRILEATDHMDIVIRDLEALAEIAEIDPDTLHHDVKNILTIHHKKTANLGIAHHRRSLGNILIAETGQRIGRHRLAVRSRERAARRYCRSASAWWPCVSRCPDRRK